MECLPITSFYCCSLRTGGILIGCLHMILFAIELLTNGETKPIFIVFTPFEILFQTFGIYGILKRKPKSMMPALFVGFCLCLYLLYHFASTTWTLIFGYPKSLENQDYELITSTVTRMFVIGLFIYFLLVQWYLYEMMKQEKNQVALFTINDIERVIIEDASVLSDMCKDGE